MSENESNFLRHEACEDCGSTDGKGVFDDGHTFCFVCETYTKADGTAEKAERTAGLIPPGTIKALPKRGLSEAVMKRYGCGIGSYNGPIGGEDGPHKVIIANYRDESGRLIAQKLRTTDKQFTFLGDKRSLPLYGRHLVRDGGKMLVITEGELDAMSVTQVMGLRYPAVSVPNGAQGAKKALRKNLDWLNRFDSVVLAFDMDEEGRKAVEECASLFAPGKVKVVHLPDGFKDPNEMLVKGEVKLLVDAIWGAREWRPDGIVSAAELWDAVMNQSEKESTPFPWSGWNEKLLGMRKGEILTLTAGSGIGKSQVAREIGFHRVADGDKVGHIALEESVSKTALEYMSLVLNKRLHLSRGDVPEEDMRAAFDATAGTGRLWLYDHFGSLEIDNLVSKVTYLAKAHEVDWIILDHISIVVSGLEDGDERRMLDNVMTRLRSLAEETNVGIIVVAHLKRPKEGSYNEGRQVSLTDLRGSAALEQLSDSVVALERDQQDEQNKNITTARCLKNRYTGETGVMGRLRFDPETGRLTEAPPKASDPDFEDESNGEDF